MCFLASRIIPEKLHFQYSLASKYIRILALQSVKYSDVDRLFGFNLYELQNKYKIKSLVCQVFSENILSFNMRHFGVQTMSSC